MQIRALWLVGLLGSSVGASGCNERVADRIVGPCQELVIGGAAFIGGTYSTPGAVTYTALIVEFKKDPIGAGTPTYLQIGPRRIRFSDATPESLSAAGFPRARSDSPATPKFGVWLGNDHSDAGVEFAFEGDRPNYFVARCYPGESCDFAVGWEGRPMITLPLAGRELAQALPEPGQLLNCRTLF